MSHGNPADIGIEITKTVERLHPRTPFIRPLSKQERDCAELEGRHPEWSFDELADMFGQPLSWLTALHERRDYRELVASHRIEEQENSSIPARKLSKSEVEDLFNQQIELSVRTLASIRDDLKETANNRIKASALILEHAPDVPAKRTEAQAPNVVINIPYQQVETIKTAALDMGDSDLIDLLEGDGYTADEGGFPSSSDTLPPPVRTRSNRRKKRGKNAS